MRSYKFIALACVLSIGSLPPATAEDLNAGSPAIVSVDSSLPFQDGFESGSLANWVVNAGGSGNTPLVLPDTTVMSSAPHSGAYAAYMGDSTSGGVAVSTLDLHLNLTAVDMAEVSFWWYTYLLEAGKSVRVDIFDGSWHINVNGLEGRPETWEQHKVLISPTEYGMGHVIFRFTTTVDSQEAADAVYIDDVTVRGITVPDDLIVTPVDPISFERITGAPFAPASAIYKIFNNGVAPVNWTGTGPAWLDASATAGTIASGAVEWVTVSPNAAALALATGSQFTEPITITNTNSGYVHSRDVTISSYQFFLSLSLNSDPGWSTQGGWAFGVPTGGGTSPGDPTSGHSGSNVYGYNLTGNYANSLAPQSLTSTAVNCTNFRDVHVSFYRWLGVESSFFDHALFEVSKNATTYTTIWQNGPLTINDGAWIPQEIDISSVADGSATVYLRWVMGPTDSSVSYCGWNIDDIIWYGLHPLPQIALSAKVPGHAGARIQYFTNEAATGVLRYGLTPGGPYPWQEISGPLTATHDFELHPLSPGTTYYYEAAFTNTFGGTNSVTGSFTTKPAVALPFSADFEAGTLDDWDQNYNATGQPVIYMDSTLENGYTPYSGTQVLTLSSIAGTTSATMDLVLDLSHVDAVELSFAWLVYSLEAGEFLRLDIYDGAWHEAVLTADTEAGGWTEERLVLSRAQYSFRNGTIIRFRGQVSSSEVQDACYVDAISVTALPDAGNLLVTPPAPARTVGPEGGPFSPICRSYTLTNLGAAPLNWSVASNKAWVTVGPAGGTLAAGASTAVDVCINIIANGMPPGSYSALAAFTDSTHSHTQNETVYLEVQEQFAGFNLDTNPGFAAAGTWAYGTPTGGGSHNLDPASGHTGTNVYGYNLSGDYPNSMPTETLTSTAINCSAYKSVTLGFWRWLAVESALFDHAKVEVSNDGSTWHNVWNHGTGTISPTMWSYCSYDISAIADGQPTVYARWIMGPTDSSITYPGWNIDDIVISGVPAIDPVDAAMPPTLTVIEPSRLFARPGQQVSYDLYYDGASSVTLAPEDITLLAMGTANANVFITGTGTLQRKARLLNLTGNGWLALNVDSGTGYDAFGEMANAVQESAWFKVDSTPPDIYISPPTLAITDSGPVTYNIIYSGADGIPLSLADVVLSSTSTANGVMSVLGTGKTLRKVRFTGTTGNGRLGFSLNANTAYDNAGNLAGAAGPSDTFRVDNVPPLNPVTTPPVASFSEPTRWSAMLGHIVKYTVVYRDAASISLAPADVVFHTTGTAAADVTITGTGALQRKVNVYNLAGEGSIGFNLAAGTAANAYGSAPETPVGPQFEVDTTPPKIYLSPPSQRITLADPVVYTVLYSGADAVTLSPGDIAFQTTGTVVVSTVATTGTGRYKRKVRLSNITGKGMLGISLNAGTAVDAAGNPAPGTGPGIVTRVLK